MTNNTVLNISETQVEENLIAFMKKYPELKSVGENMMDEINASYEFHEAEENSPEWFSFRFFGIKLRANKPQNPDAKPEDLILDSMLGFTDFMRSAKNFDMKVNKDYLVQKNGFCYNIYGKKNPMDKNSRYSEWLGFIDFDTKDRKEFENKLSDFEAMFLPALGDIPNEEKVKGLIARHA